MENKSNILKVVAGFFKKIVWTFGQHAFALIIFILFLEIIWGGLYFL